MGKKDKNLIALYLSPLYILFSWYLVRRALRWLHACKGLFGRRGFQVGFIAVYVFFASTIPVAFLLPAGGLQRAFKLMANNWMGVLLYIVLFVGTADLIKIILRATGVLKDSIYKSRKAFAVTGACVLALVVTLSAYGAIHARRIQVHTYDVAIEKNCALKELNVVLVADLHMGYNMGTPEVKQMVKKINALSPDLVCIAGDIFDNQYDALDNPAALQRALASIQSKYGVYACWGNHDVEELILAGFTFESGVPKQTDEWMKDFLAKANIHLLEDSTALIDDAFYLVGRRDAEKPGTANGTRLSSRQLLEPLDAEKPILMLDHEPRELQKLADEGVDLDLCGHTHDGQMFPASITVHIAWENPYGLLKKDNMTSIVTSGVGAFGPYMRTFTDAEIAQIRVKFK